MPSGAVDAEKAAKMATIEAAMDRAKAQREAVQPKNIEALKTAQQQEIDEIEARRQAAHLSEAAEPAAAAPASEKTE